jgi:phosphoribosylamine--glycine ligase
MFNGELSAVDPSNLHYGEVGLKDGILVTNGANGYTGVGDSIEAAREAAVALVDKVIIPNARYRCDIGQKLIDGDLERIRAWRFIDRS